MTDINRVVINVPSSAFQVGRCWPSPVCWWECPSGLVFYIYIVLVHTEGCWRLVIIINTDHCGLLLSCWSVVKYAVTQRQVKARPIRLRTVSRLVWRLSLLFISISIPSLSSQPNLANVAAIPSKIAQVKNIFSPQRLSVVFRSLLTSWWTCSAVVDVGDSRSSLWLFHVAINLIMIHWILSWE